MSHGRLVIVQEVNALLCGCVGVCLLHADHTLWGQLASVTCHASTVEHVSYAVANVVMTRLSHLSRFHQSALISCWIVCRVCGPQTVF